MAFQGVANSLCDATAAWRWLLLLLRKMPPGRSDGAQIFHVQHQAGRFLTIDSSTMRPFGMISR